MDAERYRAFTLRILAAVRPDPNVLGLVALGSTADDARAPDDHSDHDVWVVTGPNGQPRYRDRQDWLPDADRIVLVFRETEHGVKVVYDDGHLLELAVFALDDLAVARANVHRVMLDRADVTERVASLVRPPPPVEAAHIAWLFGQALTHLLVGAERAARGETLSGHRFVRERAVERLVSLVAALEPSDDGTDDLDPYRRFEVTHPEWAGAIETAVREPVARAAVALLDLLAPLAGERSELPDAALTAVRRRLDDLASDDVGGRPPRHRPSSGLPRR